MNLFPPCVLFAANVILSRVFLDFCLGFISSGKSFKPFFCRLFFAYMYKYWSLNLHHVETPKLQKDAPGRSSSLRLALFCISTLFVSFWGVFFPTSTVILYYIRTNFISQPPKKMKEKQQNTEVQESFGLCSLVCWIRQTVTLHTHRTHHYHATRSSPSPSGLEECVVVVWTWHSLKNKKGFDSTQPEQCLPPGRIITHCQSLNITISVDMPRCDCCYIFSEISW